MSSGYDIFQGSASYPLVFPLVSSSDNETPVTGASPTVLISANGGAFASPAGAVSEIGYGWYKVAGNSTDTGTLGPLILHATATGADVAAVVFAVIAVDPHAATPPANVTKWASENVVTPAISGVPIVDMWYAVGQGIILGSVTAATSTTVTLGDSPPTTSGIYTWQYISIVGGTGVGQTRVMTGYNGPTGVATVNRAWDIVPDTTSQYAIGGSAEVCGPFRPGYAQGFAFALVSSTDHISPFTAGGVTGVVSLAGAAEVAVTGVITQIGTTNRYYFAGAAADYAGNPAEFTFSASGADPVTISITTEP